MSVYGSVSQPFLVDGTLKISGIICGTPKYKKKVVWYKKKWNNYKYYFKVTKLMQF